MPIIDIWRCSVVEIAGLRGCSSTCFFTLGYPLKGSVSLACNPQYPRQFHLEGICLLVASRQL